MWDKSGLGDNNDWQAFSRRALLEVDTQHPAHGNQPSRQKLVVRFNRGRDISLDGYNSLPFTLTNGTIHRFMPGFIDLDDVEAGDVVYLMSGTYDVPRSGAYQSRLYTYDESIFVSGPG